VGSEGDCIRETFSGREKETYRPETAGFKILEYTPNRSRSLKPNGLGNEYGKRREGPGARRK